jgi:cell division protein FtsI/penicillin-binding protein 2
MKQGRRVYGARNITKYNKNTATSSSQTIVLSWLFRAVLVPFSLLFKLFEWFFEVMDRRFGRQFFILVTAVIATVLISVNFIQLFTSAKSSKDIVNLYGGTVERSRRGNIFYRDSKLARDIPLTTTELVASVAIDPNYLKKQFEKGYLTKEMVVTKLASQLNVSWKELDSVLTEQTAQQKPLSYFIIQKNASQEQNKVVEALRNDITDTAKYYNWLSSTVFEKRTYPAGRTLSSLVGYQQKDPVIKEDAYKNPECRNMINQNELRGTIESFSGLPENAIYTIGNYGLEQKYCSQLGGLNGKKISDSLVNKGFGSSKYDAINGSDIYLTIDTNLQQRAEDILQRAVEANKGQNGEVPGNGAVIVVNLEKNDYADEGAILAMASYPFADPNKYFEQNFIENGGFLNTATSIPYEVGSVAKPITVASALNQWFTEQKSAKGERLGLDPSWIYKGYGTGGKVFQQPNGKVDVIKNANNADQFNVGVGECLRNSWNTCLSDIEAMIGNGPSERVQNEMDHGKTVDYFRNRFLYGQKTKVALPADPTYNTTASFDKEAGVDFSAATWSFGQGFALTPLQLIRAYTAIGRDDGKLVEPYVVDKIVHQDVNTIERADDKTSSIYRGSGSKVLDEQAVKQIQEWMLYTQDTYGKNTGGGGGYVAGYPIGSKPGTGQIADGEILKLPRCANYSSAYECSIFEGIYNKTYIGVGPIGPTYVGKPKFAVMIKLNKAKVGVPGEFAVSSLGPFYAEMFKTTLEYFDVPKTEGR